MHLMKKLKKKNHVAFSEPDVDHSATIITLANCKQLNQRERTGRQIGNEEYRIFVANNNHVLKETVEELLIGECLLAVWI